MIKNLILGSSFIISGVAFLIGEGLIYLPLALVSLAFVGDKNG